MRRPFSLAAAFHGQSESKGADEESDQDQGVYSAEDQHVSIIVITIM